MGALDDAPQVHADDRAAWRAWLEANHATARGAWLVTWRPRSGRVGLDYEAAVEEALCFGWVDSTGGRRRRRPRQAVFRAAQAAQPMGRHEQGPGRAADRRGAHGTGRPAAIERAKAKGPGRSSTASSVWRSRAIWRPRSRVDPRPPTISRPSRRRREDAPRLGRARAATRDARVAGRRDRQGRRPQRARPRMTPPVPTELDVRPLTPGRFADLATLFEEGGDPKWCWCVYFRFRGRDWTNSTAAKNRAALEELAEPARWRPASSPTTATRSSAGSASGRARTTSVSPTRRSSPRSTTRRSGRSSASSSRAGRAARAWRRPSWTRRSPSPGPTVRRRSRRTRSDTGGGRVPAANAFHGTLSMFERAGFEVVERRQWNAASPVRPIVRLSARGERPSGPPTSSVAAPTSSSVRVDIGFARRVDCRPARKSRARSPHEEAAE